MDIINLDDYDGFSFIRFEGTKYGLIAKVYVQPESFWIRDVIKLLDNKYEGTVDNNLICTASHGIEYNDTVSFTFKD